MVAFLVALIVAFSIPAASATVDGQRLSAAAPAVRLGERLFFDPRFAQFFFARCNGNVNATLPAGDPVLDQMPFTAARSLTSPFRGQSMNCRQCHLGDDFLLEEPLAGRTYCDFSRRSPIPRRDDGLTRTARNAPLMVSLGLPREVPLLLHLDGEFASPEDLVIDTLTGRNFGWLPSEAAIAVTHVAKVIREDNGANPRLVTYPGGGGIPYRVMLLGTDPSVSTSLQMSREYRIDVDAASDDQILLAVAKLIRAYMDSLRFGTTNTGRESRSPYDLFIGKNALPSQPKNGESGLAYAQRLLALIGQRKHLVWITPEDGEFELHNQSFQFGATELHGLELFFTRAGASRRGHVGNCVACHTPPQFTDYRLHNNGVSQGEYDGIFGRGAFAALDVPGLSTRNAQFDTYLPPSSRHPKATSRFRSAPSADNPGYADLGVWNIFANPDVPKPQRALTRILCEQFGRAAKNCTQATVLPLTVAYFKTPSIRDLGQSNPYFHSGAMDTIEDVLRFYVATSDLARAGKLRNGSPELSGVRIDADDVAPLAAFLRALNEDYQ
ncbi:MAG: hypothetical protein HY271_11995 [Deltaproteobacteria bacterium]|nr:hypothetical protein [Deltaproteobacteria bacterium]